MKLTVIGCFLVLLSGIIVDTTSYVGTAAGVLVIGVIALCAACVRWLEGL